MCRICTGHHKVIQESSELPHAKKAQTSTYEIGVRIVSLFKTYQRTGFVYNQGT